MRDDETSRGSPGTPGGQLSRRSFLRAAGLAGVAAAASACAPFARPATRAPTPGGKVHLVYQDWRTDWFPGMAQQMLQEFHATHPNIRVFYVPDPENLEEKMLADMQAGTAADVFQGCCANFPTWAQKGYCLDLRPYVQADIDAETVADWDTAQYRSFFTRDGRQFGLPKYHGALGLYFNKDVFDDRRTDYPDGSWDHDDYLEAMRRVASEPEDDGSRSMYGSMIDVTWDRVQIHVNGWGGHLVDPVDPARCRMGDEDALAAQEWLRIRMCDEHLMPSALDVKRLSTRQAFLARRLAMVEEGSWALKDILAGARFRLGIAPFPAGPVRRVTLASTDGFGIFAGTRYPDAAWELLRFLISKDYGRAMSRANFLQPARASLVDEWVRHVREEYPDRTKDVDIAAFAEGHVKGYSVTTEIFANMSEAKHITDAVWDRIYTYGEMPVDSMRDACREIERSQPRSGNDGTCCGNSGLGASEVGSSPGCSFPRRLSWLRWPG